MNATPAPVGATQLDYDAAKTTGRRKAPTSKLYAEHIILTDNKRKKLLGTVQDQVRNASVAAWMIRRHLDYVSKFRLQFRSGNDDLDRLVNRLFDWHARPINFDIAARLGREEMFRMFEGEKVTAGDAAIVKLADGRLQAVESDLMAMPKAGRWLAGKKRHEDIPKRVLDSVDSATGVVMDARRPGRVAQYCICNRQPDGKSVTFDHLEDAENVIFDGYYTRFSSQVRGVSPLSSAINSIQDVYEGVDYNLAKAKVHALFGIAMMRDYAGASSDQEEVDGYGGASGLAMGTDEAKTGAAETEAGTKVISATAQELQPGQMMTIDMDTRGRIDTIESKTPSTEFKNFTEFAIRLSMLALDIPYTAFDSRSASFSGMIADQNLYEVSCRWKREKNQWKRYEYSDWLLLRAWDDPDWRIGQTAIAAGITRIRELQELVEWVPAGFPWLQKIQEVEGDGKAIALALDNPIDAARRRGGDVFRNIDKTKQVIEYARAAGVPFIVGEPGQVSATTDPTVEPQTENEDADE
jgi:capsid protein